jgi:isopenicillin N synthase-like dioxygenase
MDGKYLGAGLVYTVHKLWVATCPTASGHFLLLAEALALPPEAFLPFQYDQHRLKVMHYLALKSGQHHGIGLHEDSSG